MRAAWGKVYTGNVADKQAVVSNFVNVYDDYLRKAPQHEIQDLTGQDIKEACQHCRKSAGGMDGWYPADLAMLGGKAYQWISTMLNMIEKGAPWPRSMLQARSAFLVMDEQGTPWPTGSSSCCRLFTDGGPQCDCIISRNG